MDTDGVWKHGMEARLVVTKNARKRERLEQGGLPILAEGRSRG